MAETTQPGDSQEPGLWPLHRCHTKVGTAHGAVARAELRAWGTLAPWFAPLPFSLGSPAYHPISQLLHPGHSSTGCPRPHRFMEKLLVSLWQAGVVLWQTEGLSPRDVRPVPRGLGPASHPEFFHVAPVTGRLPQWCLPQTMAVVTSMTRTGSIC